MNPWPFTPARSPQSVDVGIVQLSSTNYRHLSPQIPWSVSLPSVYRRYISLTTLDDGNFTAVKRAGVLPEVGQLSNC